MRCLFLSLVGMVLLCEHMKASNWYDYVVVRGDNDYVTYYDSMSPQKRAPSIISEWCKKFCPDNMMKRNQIFEKPNCSSRTYFSLEGLETETRFDYGLYKMA